MRAPRRSALLKNMRQFKSSLLGLGLLALCLSQTPSGLAQSPTALLTPDIRRVGMRLACLCKGCTNTVGDCPMLECHYANPARERIREMQRAGKSDDEIVAVFVKEQGLQALSAPPTTGFSGLAWIMPWVAIGLGLCAIYLFIQKFHPKRAPASAPELDAETLERYRTNIDKDLDKLD
jgi:cytochrome c-type biogenesis protein CcmH/NrfF